MDAFNFWGMNYSSVARADQVRIFASSGNILSGVAQLYAMVDGS